MRVFVTGATGFVGSAVTRDLLANGHEVLGLVRSEQKAADFEKTGAAVLRGNLSDPDCLRRGASETDGVIHTAFNHDFSKFGANAEEDRRAIETMGAALEGTDKPMLVTGGVGLLAEGRLATEADRPPAPSDTYPRASEAAAEALAARGVNVTTVRLPQVFGKGGGGFVAYLIMLAHQKGVSAYVRDGANRWPAAHQNDVARLYRLALEHDAAHGCGDGPYHAVADEGVPLKTIAEVIGRHLDIPVVSKSPDEAADHFGWLALFAGADGPASSAHTREVLGWTPTEVDLLTDMEQPYYYEAP